MVENGIPSVICHRLYDEKENWNIKVVSKKILQIDKKKNQIIKIWNSLGDIGRYFKNSKSNISKVCNGIRFSACGWRWKYANS